MSDAFHDRNLLFGILAVQVDFLTSDQLLDAMHVWVTDKSRSLGQYILRCSFSLARVVRLTDDGSVIYRAERDHCRRFPGAASADLRGGPRRNFQVFSAQDFVAEVTQFIPEKGEHLVRYYGWYSPIDEAI